MPRWLSPVRRCGPCRRAAGPPVSIEVTTTLNWADGDVSDKTIELVVLDDGLFEGAVHESFTVTLSNPSAAASLGAATTATVSIIDDDSAPTLAFAAASATVSESAGTFMVNVIRAGNSAGTLSVQYATSADTAAEAADFVAASGTLNWADGDSAPKPISLQIVGDTVAESPATERFSVTLSTPTGGALVVSPSVVIVDIADDDAAVPVTNLAGPDQSVLSPSGLPASVVLTAASNQFESWTAVANGVWKPGPAGICALDTRPPLEQSIRSAPMSFSQRASSTDCARSQPPSA